MSAASPVHAGREGQARTGAARRATARPHEPEPGAPSRPRLPSRRPGGRRAVLQSAGGRVARPAPFSSDARRAPRGLTNRMFGPQPAGSAKPGVSSSHSAPSRAAGSARSASVGHAATHAGVCAASPPPAPALGRSARPVRRAGRSRTSSSRPSTRRTSARRTGRPSRSSGTRCTAPRGGRPRRRRASRRRATGTPRRTPGARSDGRPPTGSTSARPDAA